MEPCSAVKRFIEAGGSSGPRMGEEHRMKKRIGDGGIRRAKLVVDQEIFRAQGEAQARMPASLSGEPTAQAQQSRHLDMTWSNSF